MLFETEQFNGGFNLQNKSDQPKPASESKLLHPTVIAAVVGAVIGAIGVVSAALVGHSTNTFNLLGISASPSVSVQSVTRTVTATQTVTAVPTTSEGASAGPSPSPMPSVAGAHTTRHKAKLFVSSGYTTQYSLNSKNAQWSEQDDCCIDFDSYGGTSISLDPRTGGFVVVPDSAPTAFSTCDVSGFGHAGELVRYVDLHVNEQLCWDTTSGLLSMLKVTALDPLTFQAVTWDGKPG